jgi:hypothetical protein
MAVWELRLAEGSQQQYSGFDAILAFLKTWERQNKWCTSFEELANPIREGKRLYSPDFGWMYI